MPIYAARRAWQIAFVYFAACLLIALATGTVRRVIANLPDSSDLRNAQWWLLTLLCLAIVIIGYCVIWPRGTLTHGRPLVWRAVLGFGLAWGVSEGLLFASVWTVTGWFSAGAWLRVVLAFFVLAAFIGIWHAAFWDKQVAPEHNIAAWNGRKVLFAHVPNLCATLAHLALYDQPIVMVACQTLALMASTYFMRFPPFWE